MKHFNLKHLPIYLVGIAILLVPFFVGIKYNNGEFIVQTLLCAWIFLSLVVGAIGSKRNIGFAGAFILSFLLSPIISLVITLITGVKNETQKEILKVQKQQNNIISKTKISSSIADEIEKLGNLKEKGFITDKEFQISKEKLLK